MRLVSAISRDGEVTFISLSIRFVADCWRRVPRPELRRHPPASRDIFFRARIVGGREVVIERDSFIEMMAALGLGTDPQRIGARLRCTACRWRGGIVELAAPNTPGLLRLMEGDALPPKGVSLTRWLKMGDSERRCYRRSLR